MTNEILLMWAAVTLYAIGAVLFVVGAIFGRDRLENAALAASLAGVVPHIIAIGVRWFLRGGLQLRSVRCARAGVTRVAHAGPQAAWDRRDAARVSADRRCDARPHQ